MSQKNNILKIPEKPFGILHHAEPFPVFILKEILGLPLNFLKFLPIE
jgi:hypothetical protein